MIPGRRPACNPFRRFLNGGALPWYLAAALLVVLRCAPSLCFEQFDFDSDQAVVGLMGKHLAEARVFPLFFYGQNYMLGVEAWAAAPVMAVAGPRVAALRLPLLVVNLAVALWLMHGLLGRGVAPWLSFVATLPFIAPGVLASMLLMQTLGASVEPFLYVLGLWALRRRPLAFGALFAFAYLHREFVLFALSGMLTAWWFDRRTFGQSASRFALSALAACAVVWLAVASLAGRVNTLGPAGGAFAPASLVAQSQMVVMRLSWDPRQYLARLGAVVRGTLPDLFACRGVPAWLVGVKSQLTLGSTVAGLALGAALAIAIVIVSARTRGWRPAGDGFHLYLGSIALLDVLAYALNGGLDPSLPGVPRYLLFALLGPIAIVGAAVARYPPRLWSAALALPLGIWAGCNVVDATRLVREYVTAPPPALHRALADYLVSHRIRYGRADYWDAYVVDFLSRERAIVAPTRVSRISAYDARVDRNAANAVTIVHEPCDGGTRVASWCIDDPLHR